MSPRSPSRRRPSHARASPDSRRRFYKGLVAVGLATMILQGFLVMVGVRSGRYGLVLVNTLVFLAGATAVAVSLLALRR